MRYAPECRARYAAEMPTEINRSSLDCIADQACMVCCYQSGRYPCRPRHTVTPEQIRAAMRGTMRKNARNDQPTESGAFCDFQKFRTNFTELRLICLIRGSQKQCFLRIYVLSEFFRKLRVKFCCGFMEFIAVLYGL